MSDPFVRLAVDAVVFGYDSNHTLSVLLIQRKFDPFKGGWALPGGLLEPGESLEEAVERELEEESGVKVNYLEQLYTFGKPKRDPRNRVISVAYYGLVMRDQFELHATTDAEDAQWYGINDLPELAFDHDVILDMAMQRLRGKIAYEPIGFELLNEKFPFSDLHKLYEAVLGVQLDRRNFKKKILQLDVLEELDEKMPIEGKGRPGSLFRFNKDKYFKLKEKGIVFEI